MFSKKKILVVIGIIVAILITVYTGVFGLSSGAANMRQALSLEAAR